VVLAAQVMVVPADLCWGLTAEAQQVVIMGTQYYDGSAGSGGTDYPVTDLLQMMGRAIRAKDTPQGSGRCAPPPTPQSGLLCTPAATALLALQPCLSQAVQQ
jgi:replicative superfamily II helicase